LPDNEENLVTIMTYQQAVEAHLARSALEEAGIPAQVADEHVTSVFWSDPYLFGGVKLVVLESDADRAMEILEEIRKPLPPGDYEPGLEDISYEDEDGEEAPESEGFEFDAKEEVNQKTPWAVEFNYQDVILLAIILLLIILLTIYW